MTDLTAPQPQPRRTRAAQARADARVAFDALPAGVRDATWAHLDRLLMDASWVLARTMPENPHSYTHVRTWPNRAAFSWAVEMIRLLGERERYGGRLYTVLHRHGFKMWTMGWPTVQTILINRKPPFPPAGNQGDA